MTGEAKLTALPALRFAVRGCVGCAFVTPPHTGHARAMNESRRVTLHLPAGTVRNLDRAATAARRSRSNAAAVLLDSALAGKRRLAELARLASESTDPAAAAAREAAADHLDRHAELSGLDSAPDHDTSPETAMHHTESPEHMTPPAPARNADDKDTLPRDLPRAHGVRPSTTGGTPRNAENEIGSSSGFPGSRTTGGPR